MIYSRDLTLTALVVLIVSFLVGCGGGTSAPVAEAPTVASTPEAPASTPVPPTDVPQPTLASAPPTPEPPPATPTHPPDKYRLEKGQITSQALENNLIGDPATRNYYVYLPAGYDASDKRYPVVYALHDFLGNENDLIVMVPKLEELTASGEAGEMIMVLPNADSTFGGSWYLSSPTIGDYESYIVEELVAHIDANYRTLPERESRGITGCSMGGDGALHLALTYPEVFSVAAGVSGLYDVEEDPWWEKERARFQVEPEDLSDAHGKWFVAGAAAAASNPDKPPFYLDMPYEVVDGEGQIVPEVREKIIAADVLHDLPDYLNQPVRLNGLLVFHGQYDSFFPVEVLRDFDKTLTDMGVEHDYVEATKASEGGHCNLDWTVVLEFMADHLEF